MQKMRQGNQFQTASCFLKKAFMIALKLAYNEKKLFKTLDLLDIIRVWEYSSFSTTFCA